MNFDEMTADELNEYLAEQGVTWAEITETDRPVWTQQPMLRSKLSGII